jgi:hypothetical protein
MCAACDLLLSDCPSLARSVHVVLGRRRLWDAARARRCSSGGAGGHAVPGTRWWLQCSE